MGLLYRSAMQRLMRVRTQPVADDCWCYGFSYLSLRTVFIVMCAHVLYASAMSIAVLHHISSRDRRLQLLSELTRIVRPGGVILVCAWAIEQEKASRRQFAILEKVRSSGASAATPRGLA